MATRTTNQVRASREARGLSQSALAERTNLTRQSIGAIETGRSVPGVDVALRIAQALNCKVEDLFGGSATTEAIEVEWAGEVGLSRLSLASIAGRWVGYPLGREGARTAADALVLSTEGTTSRVAPLTTIAEAQENLAIMGCATALGLFADRLQDRRSLGRALWLPASTGAALKALATGKTHIAGVHCVQRDDQTDANVAAVRTAIGLESLEITTMARWEIGLLTRIGDDRVQTAADLADPSLRLVTREQGSGARQVLDSHLVATGLSHDTLAQTPLVAGGHLDVALAIDLGAADVGIASRDAALAFGLRFLPLADERYDLVVPTALMTSARVQRLFDVMTAQATRRELQSLGYDVRATGAHVAQINIAQAQQSR